MEDQPEGPIASTSALHDAPSAVIPTASHTEEELQAWRATQVDLKQAEVRLTILRVVGTSCN